MNCSETTNIIPFSEIMVLKKTSDVKEKIKLSLCSIQYLVLDKANVPFSFSLILQCNTDKYTFPLLGYLLSHFFSFDTMTN